MASAVTEQTRNSTERHVSGESEQSAHRSPSPHIVDNPAPASLTFQPSTMPSAQRLPPFMGPSGHVGANADLLKKLRKQVEFYFGSQNLARDAYLRSLLYAQSFVAAPLTAIASFPKVRDLCASVRGSGFDAGAPLDPASLIALALEGSNVVAVSPDGMWLCPLQEIPPFSQTAMSQRPVGIPTDYLYGNIHLPPTHAAYQQQVIDSGQNNMRAPAAVTKSGDTASTASVRSTSTPLSRSATPVGSQPSGGITAEPKEISTVILKEIPSDCDPELVMEAFTTSSVRPLSARGESDGTWHVIFSSETEAREGVFASVNRLIDGRKVKARIKGGATGMPPPSSDNSVASTSSYREMKNRQIHAAYSSRGGSGNVPAFVTHANASTMLSNQIPSVVGRRSSAPPEGVSLLEAAPSSMPLPQLHGHFPIPGVAPSLLPVPPQHSIPMYQPVTHQHAHHQRHAPHPQAIPGQFPMGYVPTYQPHGFPPHQFPPGAAFPVPYGAAPFPVHAFPGTEMAGMFGSVHVVHPHNPFGRNGSGDVGRGAMRDDGRGWRSGQQRPPHESGGGKRTRKNKGGRGSVPFGGDSEDNDNGHTSHSNLPQHQSNQPYQYKPPVGQRLGANWRRQGSVSSMASTASAPEFGDLQSFGSTHYVGGGENPYSKLGASKHSHSRSIQGGMPHDRDRLVQEAAGRNSRHPFPYHASQQQDADSEADRASVAGSDRGGGDGKSGSESVHDNNGKKKGKRKTKRDGNGAPQQNGATRTEDGRMHKDPDSINNPASTSRARPSSSLVEQESAPEELLTIDNFPALGLGGSVVVGMASASGDEAVTGTNSCQQPRAIDVPLSGYAAALLKPKPTAAASEADVSVTITHAPPNRSDDGPVVAEFTEEMDKLDLSSRGSAACEEASETENSVKLAQLVGMESEEETESCGAKIEGEPPELPGDTAAMSDATAIRQDDLAPSLRARSYEDEDVEVTHKTSENDCVAIPNENEVAPVSDVSTRGEVLPAANVPESSSVAISTDSETPKSVPATSSGEITANGNFSRTPTSAWTSKRTFADVVLKQASQST